MDSTVALARTDDYRGLEMAITPVEAKRRVQQLQAFVQSVMVRGEDFDTIPGTQKPTLLQPGAQKLAEVYGFAFTFEDVTTIEDWERGFFFYRKKCRLTSRRDGAFICEGVGSCNSREERYAARWVFDSELPKGLDKSKLRVKERRSKAGKQYKVYRVENEDIYTLVNTIEKMAAKRAFVAAVVGATRSSGIFTQDVEDLPPEAFSGPRPVPPKRPEPIEGLPERLGALLDGYADAATEAQIAGLDEERLALWPHLSRQDKHAAKAAAESAAERVRLGARDAEYEDAPAREPGEEG